MDKTLALVVSASVLLLATLILIVLFSNGLGTFNTETGKVETQTKCVQQAKKFCQGVIEASDMNSECYGSIDRASKCEEAELIVELSDLPVEE